MLLLLGRHAPRAHAIHAPNANTHIHVRRTRDRSGGAPFQPVQAGMSFPQHGDARERLAAPFALPVAADHERAVGVALAAYADAAGVGFQDAWLEMGFDGPCVEGFFEGFEGGEFLPQVEGRHGGL